MSQKIKSTSLAGLIITAMSVINCNMSFTNSSNVNEFVKVWTAALSATTFEKIKNK